MIRLKKKMWGALIIVMLTIAILISIVVSNTAPLRQGNLLNLVSNPGFEEIEQGTLTLKGWDFLASEKADIQRDEQVQHTGHCSARISGLGHEFQDRGLIALRQEVTEIPKEPLRFSIWLKGKGLNRGCVRVQYKGRLGRVVDSKRVAVLRGTFDWQEFGGILEPPERTKSLQILVELGQPKGTLWVDDVFLATEHSLPHGKFALSPDQPQPVGSAASVKFRINLGPEGLSPGGRVALCLKERPARRYFALTDLKVSSAEAGSSLKVLKSPASEARIEALSMTLCEVIYVNGPDLKPGQEVVISARVNYPDLSNVVLGVEAFVAPKASSVYVPFGDSVSLKARAIDADRLKLVAESRPPAHSTGRLTVAVLDRYDNPVREFRGTVRLSCSTESLGLPDAYTFKSADEGSHDFNVQFPGGEVSRVTAELDGKRFTSNPVLPRERNEPGIYFGDIHSHGEISSDAVGDVDLAYDYARHFMGLDLAAVTDHSRSGTKWKRLMDAGNRHNQPGRFITLLGFEWSDNVYGHRNIYYKGDSGPESPPGLKCNMEPWWRFLDENRIQALTVPHHTNTTSEVILPDGKPLWGPLDWSIINNKYQRVVEIFQSRGSFEAPGGPIPELRIIHKDVGSSVQTALAQGHRLGFIASSDTHNGRPGSKPGRCAVITSDFTRSGVWNALHDRKCYATTGAHSILFFNLNSMPMGSEIKISNPAEKRYIQWRVIGSGVIRRVDLLRNNLVTQSWLGDGKDDLKGDFICTSRLENTEWWYLRVIQEDHEMAWSSPIWVDYVS
jgi:hypothetical protein